MPLPSRQGELYEKVRSDLKNRFVPGSILPGEPEYARQLGCGRTTLRKVLERLSEEGLISRTHAGTKVLGAGSSNQVASDRPVFLLVPCPEYVDQIDSVSLRVLRQFISGAMRGAIANGRQLVTLPISETNRDNQVECTDVSIQQLSLLKPGDLVLFLGRWYRRIIQFPAETGCRFGSISQFPLPLPELLRNNSISYYGFSTTSFIASALRILKEKGLRNIGCFWFSLEQEEKLQTTRFYRKMLADSGLDGRIMAVSYHIDPREKEKALQTFCGEHRFDALVVAPHLYGPWGENAGSWMRNLTLVVGKNSPLPGVPAALPKFVLDDPMYETAVALVSRLLKDPNGFAELYPAPLLPKKGCDDHV